MLDIAMAHQIIKDILLILQKRPSCVKWGILT